MPLSPRRPPKLLRFPIYRRLRRRTAVRPFGDGPTPGQGADWRASVETGMALVRDGRFEEAEDVLERALTAFPGDASLLVEHALNAQGRGLHHEAVARWTKALATAPRDPVCHCGLSASLRETGETDAARRVIEAARRRFPRNAAVISEAAHVAEAEARFAEALALWTTIIDRRAAHPDWLRGHAHALVVLGRFAEAEAALRRALARFPDEQVLRAVEGILASSREDWPTAVALWSAYRRRFPDDGTGWEHYGRAVQGALLQAQDDRLAAAPSLAAPLKVDVVDDDATRKLMLAFESIGDSCEFGSVQRRFAAEPLGLLRWNDVRLDDLLAALAHRFEGMGLPENTDMPVIGNGEYTIRDRRWSLWMHTFLFEGQTDPAALFPKMCRRVAYLRDKLLDDLAAAEKIFVYRTPGISAARLAALHAALDAYGPIKLLAVQPVGARSDIALAAPGDIVAAGPRRWVGTLSRLGVADGNYWDIAFDEWVSICRKTAAAAAG